MITKIIKNAAIKDAADIAQMIKELGNMHETVLGSSFEGYNSKYPLIESIIYILSPRHKVIIANTENKNTGIAICKFIGKEILVLKIFVKKEYRKQGICNMMLDKIYEIAEKRNCTAIKIGVFSFNKDAINIYEHAGFSEYYKTYEFKKT